MVNLLDRAQPWFFITTSALVTMLFLVGMTVPLSWQVIVLSLAVMLLGVPHGALDPLVAYRHGLWRSPAGLVTFLLVYLLIAGMTFLVWQWSSSAVFAAFLLLSVWHFSNDWQYELSRLDRLGVAFAIIGLPSLFHTDDVLSFYALLLPKDDAIWLVASFSALWPVMLFLLMRSLISTIRTRPMIALEIVTIAVTAMLLPPLVFFALYFCLQHSPRHLLAISRNEKLRSVLLTALTLTAVTGLLAWMLFQSTSASTWHDGLLQTLFIGLVVLTVPHMLLIEITRKQKSRRMTR